MRCIYKITAFVSLCLALAGCGAEAQLRKAEQSYALGEYTSAAALYKKAYSQTPSSEKEHRAERAFMLGECYRQTNYYARAIGAYQNAVRYKYQDSIVYRHLGDMLLRSGKYKDAATNYTISLRYDPTDILATNGLESCTLAQEYKNNPTRFMVKKESLFNSKASDYSPAFGNADGTQLYFTSTRDDAEGDDINGITGMKNADIFVANQDEKGKWKKPEKIEGGPNSKYEDGACSFSSDFSTMYITRCETDPQYRRNATIVVSKRADATWKEAERYGVAGNDSLYSYAHPAASPDGKWIYFTSDMDGGYGGLDIWRVPVGGRFLGAENLGPTINTPGNEMFPTFRSNGELYFSSDGWPGMGGLDIFRATENPDFTWTITNMQAPVNSYADDFGMTFQSAYTRGYFSSNRNDGRGRDNIYSFELPETIHKLTGWVYEKDGYELPDAIVYLVGNDGTNDKLSVRSDGSFTVRVTPGTSYLLLGTAKGYLNHKQEITTDSTDQDREYVLQFPLASVSRPVLIENIFYEFNQATLTPESAQALDQLVSLLQDNPNVTIELGAHCDYKGNDDYNLRLSAQRAQSVVDYLIKKGIQSDRLTPKGYGEAQPQTVSRKIAEKHDFLTEGQILTEEFILSLPDAQQEICNQMNRRTQFKVLRTTYGLYNP